ncbi:hypothetical protein LCGC14_1015800 [marine sediment metagenome]|uniref:Uncharacterized protein n=1 Tax=marine sediment metagenome TaxID=412755 RepID=A0A0F9R4X4_9ZZZZ|nr:hypothetical protein [Candidatus Aminicenantes bacterium]HEB36545.1 hypothetical protein [Candidatus Aminicenantes bacterium]
MKKGKKFIALFLAFSLMMLSVNLYAKERRGAKLLITKKDGQQIEGELITVKPNSLLLLDTEGKDVSVGIADIKVIRVVKKSKGARTGFLIGGGLALIVGVGEIGAEVHGFIPSFIDGLIFFALPGALIGALIGSAAGTDKTIQLEGMTDSEIQEAMDKLRKKARIRDYR